MATSTPQDGAKSQLAPFAAVEIDFDTIPAAGTPEYTAFVSHYVSAAFEFIRGSSGWKKTKSFSTREGGAVQCRLLPNQVGGQLGKRGWHLRESKHDEAGCGLSYHDFRNYLLFQHATNEKMYIKSVQLVEPVSIVKQNEVEVWHNAYKLPVFTADRDFVQMLLTLDLPTHEAPFSEAHQEATLRAIRGETNDAGAGAGQQSFLIIQVPVAHRDMPHQPRMVRATFASFEAVWQEGDTVHWMMAVQTDTRGTVPVMLQEMAMPAQIAHDVPTFVAWAKQHKQAQPTPLS